MEEKNKGEIRNTDFEKDNFHENVEEKKDSLMWSEEDYTAMQNLTGFDEESIFKDQKKGISILILVIVCVICLILGMFIGYNIQPKKEVTKKEESEIAYLPQAFYTRLNQSDELYLYELNNVGEETAILDLSNSSYKYEYIENYLYLLIEKNETLKLYRYKFSKQGYRRDLVKEFDNYTSFNFMNGLIALNDDKTVNLYDLSGMIVKTFELEKANILSYNENYLVYADYKKLSIIDSKLDSTKVITENMDSFLAFSNDDIYFIENNRIYVVSTSNYDKVEVTETESTNVFKKLNDYYIFNNGKSLYILDNEMKKIKDFDYKINELLYLDRDNLVIILDDYDAHECALKLNKYYLFNINSKSIIERNIRGCLNYKVINEYIKIG